MVKAFRGYQGSQYIGTLTISRVEIGLGSFILENTSALIYFAKQNEYGQAYPTLANSITVKFMPTGDMDCVLKSQTSRMWAFQDENIRVC